MLMTSQDGIGKQKERERAMKAEEDVEGSSIWNPIKKGRIQNWESIVEAIRIFVPVVKIDTNGKRRWQCLLLVQKETESITGVEYLKSVIFVKKGPKEIHPSIVSYYWESSSLSRDNKITIVKWKALTELFSYIVAQISSLHCRLTFSSRYTFFAPSAPRGYIYVRL